MIENLDKELLKLIIEKNQKNKEVPDIEDIDRRDLGDAANKIVCELAIRQR